MVLASSDDKMGCRAGVINQYGRTSCTKVLVAAAENVLVQRREEIRNVDSSRGTQLHERHPVVRPGRRRVESPISRDYVEIVRAIRRRSGSGHADYASWAINCGVK